MKDFLKENQKKIIIGLITLAIAYLIYANWWRISGLINPHVANESPEPLTDIRKYYIEEIGDELYEDIYHTGWLGHDYAPYDSALAMFDDEIRYLADYYKNHLSAGKKLYNDINSQWYATGNSPVELMNLLSKVGRR